MTGFKLDPEELKKAINELLDIRDNLYELREKSIRLDPGELTAKDRSTQNARQAFKDLATKERDSFQGETREILKTLEKKIESYKSALAEYKKTEDAASIDTSKIQQEA